GGQLFLEDREYPFVDRVLHHQVERSHRVILADPVDTTYALLDTHRVPRQVVVHDDVSELEVDTLASGVSGNENACFGTEVFLGDAAFLQVHGAVDRDRLNPGAFQQIEQHVLSGHELGEDDDLERRVGFLTLQAPDQVQQVPGL